MIVVDDGNGDETYSDRFYLVAEIVEPCDRATVESKCAIYRRHPDCRCVLMLQQGQVRVDIARLTDAGWTDRVLTEPDDELVLEEFGLRCTLWALYRGTQLQPRRR